MLVLDFIVTVVLISVSGALAPGPLTFTVISHGMKSGARGGLAFSIGHTLFELPLVLFLAFILNFVSKGLEMNPTIRLSIGIVGGLTIIAFGAMQIYESSKSKTGNYQREAKSKLQKVRHPLVLGLVLTGLNPFFILWWLAASRELIGGALAIASFAGVLIMYVAHVWMDYVFLTGIAYLAKKGVNIIGSKGYRILVAAFGAVLIFFGANFIISVLIT